MLKVTEEFILAWMKRNNLDAPNWDNGYHPWSREDLIYMTVSKDRAIFFWNNGHGVDSVNDLVCWNLQTGERLK